MNILGRLLALLGRPKHAATIAKRTSDHVTTCRHCGERVQLSETTPAFGTALICPKCRASLIPVVERDRGCPEPCPPSEVVAYLGYTNCSLENPRCPLCSKINYSIVFPDRGIETAWYTNAQVENPKAAFVVNVQCAHCGKNFVIEWDAWPCSIPQLKRETGATTTEVEALVTELIRIGKDVGYISQTPGAAFNEKGRNARAKEIGERLDAIGGFDLMRFAAQRVRETLGTRAEQGLSWAWHEVGQWMA